MPDDSIAILFRILVSGVEILSIVLGFYCAGKLTARAREKRQKSTLYLLVFFLSAGLAPAAQLFDGIFYPFVFPVKYGYAAVILFTMVLNVALLLFATEIFAEQTSRISGRTALYRVLFTAGVAITTILATILKLEGQDVTIYLGIYMAISLLLYISLRIWATQLARKITDPVYRQALSYIGYFAIAFIGVYVFFVADSLYSGYTLWGFLGWLMFFGGVLFAYRGFIRPSKMQVRRSLQ